MDSSVSVPSERMQYRSPTGKLLRFFVGSRDGWKAKCQASKRKVKALTNDVVALRKSREHWKERARTQQSQIEQLKRELEEAKNSLP
jgi:hypothetical protein